MGGFTFPLAHPFYIDSNDPENMNHPLRKPQEYLFVKSSKITAGSLFPNPAEEKCTKMQKQASCKSGYDFSGARKSLSDHQSEGPIILSGTTS